MQKAGRTRLLSRLFCAARSPAGFCESLPANSIIGQFYKKFTQMLIGLLAGPKDQSVDAVKVTVYGPAFRRKLTGKNRLKPGLQTVLTYAKSLT